MSTSAKPWAQGARSPAERLRRAAACLRPVAQPRAQAGPRGHPQGAGQPREAGLPPADAAAGGGVHRAPCPTNCCAATTPSERQPARRLRHGRQGRTLLEAQDARAARQRGVGVAVRRLRAVLPAEARRRRGRQRLLHAHRLQAAGPRNLSLQRLCRTSAAGARLRAPDAGAGRRVPLGCRRPAPTAWSPKARTCCPGTICSAAIRRRSMPARISQSGRMLSENSVAED